MNTALEQVAKYGYLALELTCVLPEKWAMCYRHFDHQNTDTNMLVERYVASFST